jgi:hypothetical protein
MDSQPVTRLDMQSGHEMENRGREAGRRDRERGLSSIAIALAPGDYRKGYIEGYSYVDDPA